MAQSTAQHEKLPEGVQEHQDGFLVRSTDPFIRKFLFSEYPNRDLAKQAALTCLDKLKKMLEYFDSLKGKGAKAIS